MKSLYKSLFVLIFLYSCYPANYLVLKDGVFGAGKIYRPFEIYELNNVEIDSSGFPMNYSFGRIAQCYPMDTVTNQIKRKVDFSYSVSFKKKTKGYWWCLKPCKENDILDTIPIKLVNEQWYMFTHIGELVGYVKDTIINMIKKL